MSNNLVELPVRRYRRLRGFPPKFPLAVEEMERETMDQPTMVDFEVEGVLFTESGEEIYSFENSSTPIVVQQPSVEDTTFPFQTEGQPGA